MTSHPYDSRFWLSYAANMAFMVAGSIQVRYSDFVLHRLDGTELQLGLITGLAMSGAVVFRVGLGRVIDRVGAGTVWRGALLVYLIATLAHLVIEQVGIGVFAARLVTTSATAVVFGASLTHVSLRAPLERVAEIIGVLGSSGFIGLALGPNIVDFLLGPEGSADSVVHMFVASGIAAGVSLILATLATVGAQVSWRPPSRRTGVWKLLRRYQPVELLVVGTAMGLALGLPTVFLRTFVEHRQMGSAGSFFLTYATVAFVARLLTRDINARLGTRRVILLGLAMLVLTYLSFIPAHNATWLQITAVIGGAAHALIFPAVVSASTLAFPARHRGTATTLILTGFDTGNLIGLPLFGSLITAAKTLQFAPYKVAFGVVALLILAAGLLFYAAGPHALSVRHRRPRD
jgi:MFS family permease